MKSSNERAQTIASTSDLAAGSKDRTRSGGVLVIVV